VKLVSHVFTRTPMVFVTSHAKPNSLRSGDLPGIFSALNPKWEDGSPLHIILRTRVDADTVLAGWAVPGLAEAMEHARVRTDVPVAATDQDNVTIAQRLPGSLTVAGYGQIIAEKCDLRLVPIDGVTPSLETLSDGTYRFAKPFYLVFPADRSAGAEQLLQFLNSAEARKILLPLGYLPVAE
jgi:phosphate transport system substrate-binding protein